MTNQRASETEEMRSTETPKNTSMYQSKGTATTFDKVLQIQSLVRVGACATDSVMNIDLNEMGYLGVFEIINQLCDEIYTELEGLQNVSEA